VPSNKAADIVPFCSEPFEMYFSVTNDDFTNDTSNPKHAQ